MGHPCNLADAGLPSRQKRGKFNSQELSELTNKVVARSQMMAALGQSYASVTNSVMAGFAQFKNMVDNMWSQHIGRLVNLAPNQMEHLQSWMARYAGQKQGLLGLNPSTNYTVPGEVRYNLLQAGRVADGIVEIQGKLFALKQVKELSDAIKSIASVKGIRGYNMQELMYHTLESGLADKNAAIYGNTPNMIAEVNRTVNNWHNMMEGLGFDLVDRQNIIQAAQKVATSFESMRLAAQTFNIDIPKLYNIGYVPREFTPDFKFRVEDFAEQEKNLFQEFTNNPLSMSTMHSKSRGTWKYIPEDTVFLQQLTGLSPTQMNDLMADGTVWRNYLMNNFSDDQMELLVDSGVMSKLPMTSPEVFDYLVRTYELPYKELNEMFILDPQHAIKTYSASLQHTVRNSAMLKVIGREGMQAGWAVTSEQVKANPQLANFVKLGGVDHPVIKGALEGSGADALYVHPIVAEQLKGLADLASSPSQLGNFAKNWMVLSNVLKSMYITSSNVTYLGRQFLSNMISLHSMGAGIHNFLPAMYDVIRAHQYGLDAFDNTKPYRKIAGETLTKRQFMEKVFMVRGVPFTPLVPGERPQFPTWNRLNPKNLGRQLMYLWSYANNTPYGSPFDKGWRAGKYAGKVLYDAQDEVYKIVAGLGSFIDLSARLAAYKSLADLPAGVTSALDRTGQLLTGASVQRFGDLDKMSRYIDDYLPMFDDIGSVTATTARFLIPFASWSMTNLPMGLRHVMRHPSKFYAYNRVLSYITNENLNGDTVAEGEMNSYDLDEYPIVLRRDPVDKRTIILTPTNYDPVLGVVSYLRQNKEAFEQMFLGWYPENTQKQREKIRQELGQALPAWQQMLYAQAGKTYLGPILELVTGIDPQTGMSVKEKPFTDNTYLGLKVPVALQAVLSLVPPVDALNRWNPEIPFSNGRHIFGLAPVLDAQTGQEIRPEQLSIFGQPRQQRDATILDDADRDWAFKMMRLAGFRVRTVDGLANMGYSYEDTKNLLGTLHSTISRNQVEIATMSDPKARQAATEKLNHMIDVWLQTQWDLGRITDWMIKNKVPAKQAFLEMKKRQVVTSDLPLPGADFFQKELMEAAKMRRKTDRLVQNQEAVRPSSPGK